MPVVSVTAATWDCSYSERDNSEELFEHRHFWGPEESPDRRLHISWKFEDVNQGTNSFQDQAIVYGSGITSNTWCYIHPLKSYLLSQAAPLLICITFPFRDLVLSLARSSVYLLHRDIWYRTMKPFMCRCNPRQCWKHEHRQNNHNRIVWSESNQKTFMKDDFTHSCLLHFWY